MPGTYRFALLSLWIGGFFTTTAFGQDFLPNGRARINELQRVDHNFRATTMNFANVTATQIKPTVNEQTGNEKEVEVGDVDNDGDPDVVIASARSFFAAGARRNKLYLNNNGILDEVTNDKVPGFMNVEVSRNAFLRDYDNDGWLDIIIVNDNFAGPSVGTTRFYANKHPGGVFSHFEDETSRLNGAVGDACGGFSDDFNRDGEDDLYLGNYPGQPQDKLYKNDGTGNFSNVTSGNIPPDSDYTVDVASADMNGDGKIDLLVGNDGDPAYIYYNDNQGNGSGVGDFNYANSKQSFSAQAGLYPALEPGDFNGDGKMDFYFANKGPNSDDKLMINIGNDANNKAVFSEIIVPGIVSDSPTAKVTVSDLNRDGRPDLIVMGGDTLGQFAPARRPVIFRNTSINGQVSFVEWTPASAFPTGETHAGWHAAVFDSNGDKRQDILVGGMNNDFLFVGVPTPFAHDGALAAGLPPMHDAAPFGVNGKIQTGQMKDFSANDIPAAATVCAVLRSSAAVTLEVFNGSGGLIVASDRGGLGVEEAVQFTAPGGPVIFRVTGNMAKSFGDKYVLEILSRDD